MANYQDMDLMSVGEHCALQDCKRLDFLPYKCVHCKKKFCQEHYEVSHHRCTQFQSKDRIIPPCPLCGKLVALSANETINDQVEKHIRSGCQALVAQQRKKNKCSQTNCKQSSLVPLYCQKCHRNFCVRHRHSDDHTCIAHVPTTIAVH